MSSVETPDLKVEATQPQPTPHESEIAEPQAAEPKPAGEPAAAGVASASATEPAAPPAPPMSKNALKRLRKQQEWEDSKDDRRKRRKEKRHERKGRLRSERAALLAQGVDPATLFPQKPPATLVPVALIVDCDFESYMTDKERVSLSSQVTRCYSDNRNARYKAHLWMAGWRGRLEERFTTALRSQHTNWKGVGFEAGGFLAAAERARQRMREPGAGQMIAPLQRGLDEPGLAAWAKDETEPFPLPDEPAPEPDAAHADVVYLTSESPYTLQRLEPHTSYVIGGLVDKNREKGLCYRRARALGIRTARLPIGQFMVMQSRQVLATNHVVEIMLRWLEYEDWGKAFMAVIPKRKGGKLIGEGEGGEEEGEEEDDGGEEEREEDDGAKAEGDAGAGHEMEVDASAKEAGSAEAEADQGEEVAAPQ